MKYSKESIDMSKEPTGLKYPMVDLFTDVTMSFMYLNMLTASNLLLLSAPWLFTQAWMKGLESERVAALEQKEPLSDNVKNYSNRRSPAVLPSSLKP
jgi:hypothetical protein